MATVFFFFVCVLCFRCRTAMSKSPSPKKGAQADGDANEVIYEVGPKTINDVFNGFLGTEEENSAIGVEWYNLMNHDKLQLDRRKAEIEARKERRRVRREKKRKDDEERRLLERRNNPQNLAVYAAQIQKYFRGYPTRKKFLRLKDAFQDRQRKKAIIIIVDEYDDRRVRPPSLLARDAFEMARILQYWNFIVDIYSSSSGDPQFRPTKANISRALEQAKATEPDTFLWVHVCGNGGTATVNGRNPHRQAQKEQLLLQTPRTRLLTALHLSHRRAAAGGASVGDVCHFLLPSDGKSTRLTFDNITTFDEILDLFRFPASAKIFDHPAAQRVVTIEVAPFGFVEGHQGGGCAVFASTVTPQTIYELPPGSLGTAVNGGGGSLIEPCRALLSGCLVEALRGGFWRKTEKSGPTLFAADLSAAIEAAMLGMGIVGEKKGSSWSNIPILRGERVASSMSFVERVYCSTLTPLPGFVTSPPSTTMQAPGTSAMTQGGGPISGTLPLGDATLSGTVGGGTLSGADGSLSGVNGSLMTSTMSVATRPGKQLRRRKHPSATRTCLMCVTLRIDITRADSRVDVFSQDFIAVVAQYLSVIAQPDPTISLHRHLKVSFGRVKPFYKLTIGINGTFIDVSARCKTKGGESTIWNDLVASLTGGNSKAGGVDMSTTSICCGKGEEGDGVAVVLQVSSSEMLQAVLSRVDTIPTVLNGITYSTLHVEMDVDVVGTVANYERLLGHARGLHTVAAGPTSAAGRGGSGFHGVGAGALVSASSAGSSSATSTAAAVANAISALLRTCATLNGNGPGNTSSFVNTSMSADHTTADLLRAVVGGGDVPVLFDSPPADEATVEHHLSQACVALGLRNAEQIITLLASQQLVAVVSVEQTCQRINDLDDMAMDSLMRRERPQGAPVGFTHTGTALCVVAMAGTLDMKLRQAQELAAVGAVYEAFYGIRFLLWDITEPVRMDPKDSVPRERLAKLLDAIRANVSNNNFPAMLVLDLFKKRYYRARLLGTSPVFMANHITHFCDEFVKGALGELLPPVKGCRVYGSGVHDTKYTLIAI